MTKSTWWKARIDPYLKQGLSEAEAEAKIREFMKTIGAKGANTKHPDKGFGSSRERAIQAANKRWHNESNT